MKVIKNKQLNTIAVDLTPVLPGGKNGGAKIFVLELLRHMAGIAPQTQFILLTQSPSHEELSTLDHPNMRRLMVVGPEVTNSIRPQLNSFASRILPHLPPRIRSIVNRFSGKIHSILKRSGSSLLLRDMRVDLLFCPFTAPTYFEPGVPTVCTIHDLQFKTYPEFFTPEDIAHRERTFIESCQKATMLAAVSNYSREAAILHGSINPYHIRTIYHRMAQRITSAANDEKAVFKRLGLNPQRYLIYPANFWKHKNHEMLLTAFGIACHNGISEDIKLICTGSPGPRKELLMRAACALNLGDRILFPGYLPDMFLANLINNSAGVVFPSLYEGFGLPVIEAMAAGVPVACSNTTSLPEVASDAAIFFDPRVPIQMSEAITSLVENKNLRSKLIQAGKKRAIEFSDAGLMAKEYLELFQDALSIKTNKNLLSGVYTDGWTGHYLNIQVATADCSQTLEIEFSAPNWLPQKHFSVQVLNSGNRPCKTLSIIPGEKASLSIPVEANGGFFRIKIAPTFVPALSSHGDDQRELSIILQSCRLIRSDGKNFELYSGNFHHEG